VFVFPWSILIQNVGGKSHSSQNPLVVHRTWQFPLDQHNHMITLSQNDKASKRLCGCVIWEGGQLQNGDWIFFYFFFKPLFIRTSLQKKDKNVLSSLMMRTKSHRL
jgi:hypothetical protein